MDTKKKELVGEFKKAGREWQPTQTPEQVQVHDFPSQAVGKAIPYGVYDMARNEAWVSVGRDHDTSAFAVAAIRQWWSMMGRAAYPAATHLLITAEQAEATDIARAPGRPSCSAWPTPSGCGSPCATFRRGRASGTRSSTASSVTSPELAGKPLRTFDTIVDLIGHTSTATGLRVRAKLDKRRYRTGIKITAAEMRDVALHRHDFHGDWNSGSATRNLITQF